MLDFVLGVIFLEENLYIEVYLIEKIVMVTVLEINLYEEKVKEWGMFFLENRRFGRKSRVIVKFVESFYEFIFGCCRVKSRVRGRNNISYSVVKNGVCLLFFLDYFYYGVLFYFYRLIILLFLWVFIILVFFL